MNGITKQGEKYTTLKEIAEVTGAAYRTVAAYAQKAGWTENGKQTFLNENQATLIIEAMKQGAKENHSNTLLSSMQGVETSKSRALRIELLHKQIEAELEVEIAELRAKNEALEVEVDERRLIQDEHDTWISVKRHYAERATPISLSEAARIGKELSALSRELGCEIKKVNDERFGIVNAYHKDVWDYFICPED
jgi:hypothetical protein